MGGALLLRRSCGILEEGVTSGMFRQEEREKGRRHRGIEMQVREKRECSGCF